MPCVVAGQDGTASTSAIAPRATAPRTTVLTSTAKNSSISRATSQTMTNPRPEMPSQATSGAYGLSDCDSATRPQEKPP